MIAQNRQFVVVNAFAGSPFGGNPAAVFTNASGLETETMQALARQLNLVETVFVLPGDAVDFHLRYFTLQPDGAVHYLTAAEILAEEGCTTRTASASSALAGGTR